MTRTFANKTKESCAEDKVMTPYPVACKLLTHAFPWDIRGDVLEPFMGNGTFYTAIEERHKSGNLYWCEIDAGADFFDWKKHVDYIITNPPYSNYEAVLERCFEIADNVLFLVPLNKITNSLGRINKIFAYGGVYKLWVFSGTRAGFHFGFPACFVWFKRGYKGNIQIGKIEL